MESKFCNICQEDSVDYVTTACGHFYHKRCLLDMAVLYLQTKCCTCRYKLEFDWVISLASVDECVQLQSQIERRVFEMWMQLNKRRFFLGLPLYNAPELIQSAWKMTSDVLSNIQEFQSDLCNQEELLGFAQSPQSGRSLSSEALMQILYSADQAERVT